MKILPAVKDDPVEELAQIQEILFRVAVNLENERCGNAAMVVALMGNRIRAVMERIERKVASDGAGSKN